MKTTRAQSSLLIIALITTPTVGHARFLQTDPVGYDDQINLYAYVGNDPVNLIDPTGMRNCDPKDTSCIETPESGQNPSTPEDNPDETDKKDEIIVNGQKKKENSDGSDEKFFEVTIVGMDERKLKQQDIKCPNGSSVTVGTTAPLSSGSSASHSHTGSHSGVPGPGDNNYGNTSNTAYLITPSRAFGIDRASNGTYRTRILSGPGLSASEQSDLVSNMQNWESGNSSNKSKTFAQRFC